MKKFQIITFAFIFISILSCTENETEEVIEEQTSNIEKNTVLSTDNTGILNYFSFVKGDLQTGTVFSITAFEKMPTLTNSDTGNSILFYFKEVPTTSTTLTHFGGFDVNATQFFVSNVELNGKKWYTPFVGDDPTGELKITIENEIATFTVEEIELSDNFINPITETKKISFSVSVATSYFSSHNTGFVDLSN